MKHFEKYATPISIVVAGALVGAGIVVAKFTTNAPTNTATNAQPQNEADVIKQITNLPILKQLKVNKNTLASCIDSKQTASVVDGDTQLADAAGLRGTPHMIVLMKKDGKDVQFPLFGAQPKEVIEQAIADGKTPKEQASLVGKIATQVIRPTDHVLGDPATAPATIIEYSDIECPFCKQLHPTLQQLVQEGKIAWIYRHSPIPQLHPYAYVKALATECVSASNGQDAFWKYLDTLVLNK